ncbi:Reverse transcriptase (RNA-dependent DNA polymerase) [[Clostridium] sordellii]|uniref:reverse transcriptase domain-containing protein n=2 Tax=Paraclostridium sordellii TaxID=1505 RepID=UPI0005DBB934|nr:reverse transcriptase domain-containing protein [Paeniclostridium sordellii]CEP87197.1 Reverse transcriptase (RNA-dependent DNA polymerase) [[Clostridium] sordellii] [Paeniclostridium sordellii]
MCNNLKFRQIMGKKDEEVITKDELIEILKVCYKKLKSYVYHDNSNLFIREQICKYESESIEQYEQDKTKNIDILHYKIEKLASRIINGDLKNNTKNINVDFYCLPKTVEGQEKNSKNDISNFTTSKDYELSKVTYFIDIEVEYHILGVLWVMLFGREVESKYKKYTYGNKLEDKFDYDNIKLFIPYFDQYQQWRDRGISSVEQMIKEEKRCLMITLDIKDYFYTANIDFDKLKYDLLLVDSDKDKYKDKNTEDNIIKQNLKFIINDIVINIFNKYTKIIKGREDENIIPIGFIPSYIIFNWYLNEFDNQVIKELNPIYYGRYIDDITIVIPINIDDDKNESYKEILHERFYKKGIFGYGIQKKNNRENSVNVEDLLIKLDNKNEFENIRNIIKNIPRQEFKLKSKLINCLNKAIKDIDKAIKEIDTIIENDELEEYNKFKKEVEKVERYLKTLYKKDFSEIIYLDWNSDEKIEFLLDSLEIIYEYHRISDIVSNLTKMFFISLEFEHDQVKKVYLISEYYKQNNRKTKTHLANLCIQEAKVKVYDFKSDGSKALLNNFKKNLFKTASAFNFLPEKSSIIEEFDNEVYEIDYSGSINKLSSIDNFKVNKYGVSKFLAQVIYSDKLENNQNTDEVEDKILCLFKNNTCIDLYGLWEKVMMYYMIKNQHDYLMKFIKEILISIDKLGCNIDRYQLYHKIYTEKEDINDYILDITKESLIKHLGICLSMVYSLNDELFPSQIKESDYNKVILNSIQKMLNKDERLKNEKIDNYIDNNLNNIYTIKENIRKSNMIRHAIVRETLMNYTTCVTKNTGKKNINLIEDRYFDLDIRSDLRCSKLNKNYRDRYNCESSKHYDECVFKINYDYAKYSPRFVHLHELILYNISLMISKGEIVTVKEYMQESIDRFRRINNLPKKGDDYNNIYYNIKEKLDEDNRYKLSKNDYLIVQTESNINIIDVKSQNKLDKLKLGIVNMKVSGNDIDLSFSKTPNLHSSRIQKISCLLNEAVKNKANMIIFPEVSIPHQLINSICRFSMKHNIAIVCGLEHVIYENGLCCNYLATILPGKYNEYNHAMVKLRLKNHYSPREKEYVRGFNWDLPIMVNKHDEELSNNDYKYKSECEKCEKDKKETFIKEYDLFKWSGVDFSTYSCFELADIKDRSLFTSHVDLLIGSIHNKDINYYSNIIESLSRDVHCYFAQVNNSELGDNRVISPSKSVNKNILQITGGENDLVLIAEIDIKSLRDFQKKAHNLQVQDDRFKPVPPGFDYNNVKLRDEVPL